ncbi:MAG: pilus biosis protein [Verrucomicrobiales bacterium]|nr:pilus biosis protein [Verrucomicrobiales bacterium]
MRLFFDTNILLDVFPNRLGKASSLMVLNASVALGNEGWIAWHTLSNGFYIVRRETKSLNEAKRFTRELLIWCNVATVGTAEAVAADNMNRNDIEDAMQMAAAVACHSDVIITRNLPDFVASPIPALTPEQFLERWPQPGD